MSWLLFAFLTLALTVFIVLAYHRRWRWAGFAETRRNKADDEDAQPAKTLWDWLQLLVIPLVLAGLAFLLNTSQTDREQRREDQRAALQRATAADAAREEALRAYLTQMSGLMLDRHLLRSRPDADVRAVARTVTLTALRRVDAERRGLMVRFLHEARLLLPRDTKVKLHDANLRSADLRRAFLVQAELGGADLRGADLIGAELGGADLSRGTDLRRADLRSALLQGADFRSSDLRGADLRGALLESRILPDSAGTVLPPANLLEARYDSETRWPDGFDPAAAGATKRP
jgi:uncharacterized protein YjbI with pentapeptide repeats